MGNLKDIQDITGLTSEAIFNIRKPVDYMCSDIDSHIKDIRTQCDYIMDGNEEDNMNKRKTKKRLHLNNKEFQILFRSGKKYFRYAINNLCLAFGCSSLEYWIYFFEGKRVDGSIYYKSISRLVLR